MACGGVRSQCQRQCQSIRPAKRCIQSLLSQGGDGVRCCGVGQAGCQSLKLACPLFAQGRMVRFAPQTGRQMADDQGHHQHDGQRNQVLPAVYFKRPARWHKKEGQRGHGTHRTHGRLNPVQPVGRKHNHQHIKHGLAGQRHIGVQQCAARRSRCQQPCNGSPAAGRMHPRL